MSNRYAGGVKLHVHGENHRTGLEYRRSGLALAQSRHFGAVVDNGHSDFIAAGQFDVDFGIDCAEFDVADHALQLVASRNRVIVTVFMPKRLAHYYFFKFVPEVVSEITYDRLRFPCNIFCL